MEPFTTVRINMTNSNKILVAEVPVKDGKAMVDLSVILSNGDGSGGDGSAPSA